MPLTLTFGTLRLLAFVSLCLACGALPAAEGPRPPYNVLFIAIDDMNDWVGAFGGAPQERSATPKMDQFARNGSVVFQQANCAGPICDPSRSALLSGFMPNRSGVWMRQAPNLEIAKSPKRAKRTRRMPTCGRNHPAV